MNLKDMQTSEFLDHPHNWRKPTYQELESRLANRNSIIIALGAAVIILIAAIVIILCMI